jgi:hypothetical protein
VNSREPSKRIDKYVPENASESNPMLLMIVLTVKAISKNQMFCVLESLDFCVEIESQFMGQIVGRK